MCMALPFDLEPVVFVEELDLTKTFEIDSNRRSISWIVGIGIDTRYPTSSTWSNVLDGRKDSRKRTHDITQEDSYRCGARQWH